MKILLIYLKNQKQTEEKKKRMNKKINVLQTIDQFLQISLEFLKLFFILSGIGYYIGLSLESDTNDYIQIMLIITQGIVFTKIMFCFFDYSKYLKEILFDIFSLIIVWLGSEGIMLPYSENSMMTVALILIINLVLHKLISIPIEKSHMEISDVAIEKRRV